MSRASFHSAHPLTPWGWNAERAADWPGELHPDAEPGRVVSDHGPLCHVQLADHVVVASVPGRILGERGASPVCGDWVAVVREAGGASIADVLPRRSLVRRQAAGEAVVPQNLAANVDLVAVASSLNRDLNLRRLERYLVMIRASGAEPLIVLTKADLVPAWQPLFDDVVAVADGAPVYVVSSVDGRGLDDLEGRLGPGRTIAFLGSSGAGKSTLVNRLAGTDVMITQSIRSKDDRGRHTTTHRQLILLPKSRGVLLDTPGLREVLPWVDDASTPAAFPEIDELAGFCHFRNCSHHGERGCAVQEAVDAGTLPADRLAGWQKLRRELEALDARRAMRGLATQRGRGGRPR